MTHIPKAVLQIRDASFMKKKGLDDSLVMHFWNSDGAMFSSKYKALFRVSMWTCTYIFQLKLWIAEIQCFDISNKFSFRQNSNNARLKKL